MSWQARPTTYRGIQMRSRLEARFAEALDSPAAIADGWRWTYEPRAFANEHGQYLPDFEVWMGDLGPIYMEVKPTIDKALMVLERMQIIWSSEPSALLVAIPGDSPVQFVGSRRKGWQLSGPFGGFNG